MLLSRSKFALRTLRVAVVASARQALTPSICLVQRSAASSSSSSSSGSGGVGGGPKKKNEGLPVPDEFYDDEVEKEKEFMDMANSLLGAGLESLTSMPESEVKRWNDLKKEQNPKDFNLFKLVSGEEKMEGDGSKEWEQEKINFSDVPRDEEGVFESSPAHSALVEMFSNEDMAEHLEAFQPKTLLPEEYLNYSVPWRNVEEFPDPMLEKFVPKTSPELYRHDRQGLRACPGKLQRRGPKPELRCHLIDLDDLNYLDVVTLKRFLSDDSEILGKKHTGLCAKCQRKVAKTIKRARNFGLVPHLGEYVLSDSRPLQRGKGVQYHDCANVGDQHFKSKTIL